MILFISHLFCPCTMSSANPSHPTNHAAYLPSRLASSLSVSTAPYTPATADTLVVRVRAVAINPVDWLIQRRGNLMFTWLEYPFILGFDVAGEVVEVGSSVASFRVGDRVGGFANGTDKPVNDAAQGGFQEYVVLQPDVTFQIPDIMSFEEAAVIPLGLVTAIAALFETDQLGLQLPSEPRGEKSNQTVLIWGGSTSVGCNAIQLAVAAGYDVVSTASPKNFDFVKKLGASQVFDYNSPTVVADILAALQGQPLAGTLSIGDGAAEQCMTIVGGAAPGSKKHVAMATFPLLPEGAKTPGLPSTMAYFASWIVRYKARGMFKGVSSAFVQATNATRSGQGRAVFRDFLPQALQRGSFVPAPSPEVVGHGLESIEPAMEAQRKGVSAKKLVVRL